MSGSGDESVAARVLRHTALSAPALVPEVRVHRVTHESPLWRMGEAGLRALSDTDPFWAFTWEGGTALARYVLDHPEVVRGRTVFDLGCGSAVEGVAACLAGAREVIANDLDPLALAAAALTAEANGARLTLDPRDRVGDALEGVDVLLLGDMTYEPELSARLLAWGAELAARGVTVLLGDPGRGNLDDASVERLAAYPVLVNDPTLPRCERETGVFTLRRGG
ncbi:MAG: 50S ribosomal protein L11 methyltransferase [Polyangiales bacterium]